MKLMIEIPLDLYERCKRGDYELFDDAVRNNAIANGTPITEGDLISRSELRKTFIKWSCADCHFRTSEKPTDICCDDCYAQAIKDLINNAPSIGGNQMAKEIIERFMKGLEENT